MDGHAEVTSTQLSLTRISQKTNKMALNRILWRLVFPMAIRFIPTRSREALVAQASEDFSAAYGVILHYDAARDSILELWTGGAAQALRTKLGDLIAGLNQEDRSMRVACLFLIRDYWPTMNQLIGECLRLAFEDSDSIVRGVALAVLQSFDGRIEDPTGILREILYVDMDHNLEDVSDRVRDADLVLAEAENEIHHDHRQLIGPLLDQMLDSVELTEAYLENSDPDIRYVALNMMAFHWKPTRKAAELSLRVARQDPNPRTRLSAVSAIGQFYRGSEDQIAGRLLAEIVSESSEDVDIRFIAYQGLFEIKGVPYFERPYQNKMPPDFQFPHDVDWSFVDSWRQ